ncbi:hypothetical protein MTBPR1_40202 [Candidatus Terasakiella magnetica]|uniref:Uncharacterized protein n=1 Tax=Candidatus Terasakiella magnetica TaxID=1867952 RepID=A0A1C3RIT3_9PROT|nr:hypothetical protein [Candidatus Terasakiella magnetica]SCA57179.1 hypothetical protein MTBPR1_40202 [Candidatus Terasakiella magnetica]
MTNPMFDANIQATLEKLDQSVPKKKRFFWPLVSGLSVLVVSLGVGLWSYERYMPSITQDDLVRMIVVSSRNGQVDPVRLMYKVEEQVGKKVDDFNRLDRAQAVEYLLEKMELNKSRQELVVY